MSDKKESQKRINHATERIDDMKSLLSNPLPKWEKKVYEDLLQYYTDLLKSYYK